jgi:hypothetical protein
MKRIHDIALTLFYLTLLMFACNGTPVISPEQLAGRWDIKEAFRNERPTESMEALFFEFKPNGRMVTNLIGADVEAAYELKRDKILQRKSDMEADYLIEGFTDTTLTLSTTLRDYKFRFFLHKKSK